MEDVAQFEFVYEDKFTGRYVYSSHSTDFWTEAADAFVEFLRGCGFVVSKEEAALYIAERIEEYEDATKTKE